MGGVAYGQAGACGARVGGWVGGVDAVGWSVEERAIESEPFLFFQVQVPSVLTHLGRRSTRYFCPSPPLLPWAARGWRDCVGMEEKRGRERGSLSESLIPPPLVDVRHNWALCVRARVSSSPPFLALSCPSIGPSVCPPTPDPPTLLPY